MRTERRIAVSVANGLVALWFLLGAAAAQGQTVICGSDPCGPGDTNATAILNLEVIGDQVVGDLYDVEFMFDFGADLFTLPLSFPTGLQALAATSAVSDALNTKSQVTTVGPQLSTFYNVPFEFELQIGWSTRSAEYFPIAGGWQPLMDAGVVTNGTPSSFAVFTLLPEPGAALSLAAALATLGVVGRRKQASKRTA